MNARKRRSMSRQARRRAERSARIAAYWREIVTLNIATHGLDTSIADWYLDSERDDWAFDEWEPNLSWRTMRIRREDVRQYLALYNDLLGSWWSPNQEHNGVAEQYARDAEEDQLLMAHIESLANW